MKKQIRSSADAGAFEPSGAEWSDKPLIGKWLKAGVWEKGEVSYPEEGTPQGGVISPLLSNIHLPEVLDKWFVESVQSACQGRTFMVRYADDFVMDFEEPDALISLVRISGGRRPAFGRAALSRKESSPHASRSHDFSAAAKKETTRPPRWLSDENKNLRMSSRRHTDFPRRPRGHLRRQIPRRLESQRSRSMDRKGRHPHRHER